MRDFRSFWTSGLLWASRVNFKGLGFKAPKTFKGLTAVTTSSGFVISRFSAAMRGIQLGCLQSLLKGRDGGGRGQGLLGERERDTYICIYIYVSGTFAYNVLIPLGGVYYRYSRDRFR